MRSALVRAAALCALAAAPAGAQSDEELAKQLANPVASLISVPFQLNYDGHVGQERAGDRAYLNFQPVIPIDLSERWNLISRTIVPITWQDDVRPGATDFGPGDITQSFFFSPKEELGGWIVGAGPILLLPTGVSHLSGDQWGAGPTVVILRQSGGWTYGALLNHIWSFAGTDRKPDVSSTFLQPFLTYTTKSAWTFTLQTESLYDWKATDWSVPINAVVSKVVKLGPQRIQLAGGLRYWADGPDSGPHDFGGRFAMTLLFPTARPPAPAEPSSRTSSR